MKAMIVAAGLGSRLKPITNTLPKALVPVAGKPLLEHIIRKLIGAGVTEIVINVHHFSEQIIRFVQDNHSFGITIHFSDESDELLDTGGGIKNARKWLEGSALDSSPLVDITPNAGIAEVLGGEPFLVHNVDILSNLDIAALYAQHIRTKPLATLVVSERPTSRYLLFDDDDRLVGWNNITTGELKPADLQHALLKSDDLQHALLKSDELPPADLNPIECMNAEPNRPSPYKKLAFSGIHIISPEIFKLMESWPHRFSIIEFYLQYLKIATIVSYRQPAYEMIDVGKPESLSAATSFLLKSMK